MVNSGALKLKKRSRTVLKKPTNHANGTQVKINGRIGTDRRARKEMFSWKNIGHSANQWWTMTSTASRYKKDSCNLQSWLHTSHHLSSVWWYTWSRVKTKTCFFATLSKNNFMAQIRVVKDMITEFAQCTINTVKNYSFSRLVKKWNTGKTYFQSRERFTPE